MLVFSGTANQMLAEEVVKIVKLRISKAEVIRFNNSEVRVRICESVKDKETAVIQSTSNPADTNLMELFFFCDALKRSGARKVTGIIPYFGYARQNIQHRPGEDVSANVIIRFLETIGFDEIITIDLHDQATEGVFSIPLKALTAVPQLAKAAKQYLASTVAEKIVVVSPDQGGIERARRFAEEFFGKATDIIIIEKKRNLDQIHEIKDLQLYGEVKGKTVILVDDIITSGGTLIQAGELCLAKGAKNVIAAVTHHDLSEKAPDKIQKSVIEKLFTTNTILLRKDQEFPKLVEVSIAPVIAKEFKA